MIDYTRSCVRQCKSVSTTSENSDVWFTKFTCCSPKRCHRRFQVQPVGDGKTCAQIGPTPWHVASSTGSSANGLPWRVLLCTVWGPTLNKRVVDRTVVPWIAWWMRLVCTKKHEHQESIDGLPMFVELLRFLFSMLVPQWCLRLYRVQDYNMLGFM